jgi:glutamine synthetase
MENALEIAEKTYVDVNIFDDEHEDKVKELQQLPVNCWESSEMLLLHADVYTKYDVFSKEIIEGLARQLKSYKDQNTS